MLVGGFGDERMPGDFAQNARELRALGVPHYIEAQVRPSRLRLFLRTMA